MSINDLDVSIQVRSSDHSVSGSTQKFKDEDLQQIALLVSNAVNVFQAELAEASAKSAGSLSLSELDITFGVDLKAKGGLAIASIFQAGVEAGAAFQVHVKLTR